MYIIQFRKLGIKDLAFALKSQKDKLVSLDPFIEAGLVKELKPEDEGEFVKMLVETHPSHEKNFEHFLVDPPEAIMPTDIITALRERSDIIPTLCVVYPTKQFGTHGVFSIERIKDQHELSLLAREAEADGILTLDRKKRVV